MKIQCYVQLHFKTWSTIQYLVYVKKSISSLFPNLSSYQDESVYETAWHSKENFYILVIIISDNEIERPLFLSIIESVVGRNASYPVRKVYFKSIFFVQ